MREDSFWRKIRKMIDPTLVYCVRVENGLGAGTPDVFYQSKPGRHAGWMETKYRARCPFHEQTLLFPGTTGLRNEQRAWWLQYLLMGGRGYFLVGVSGEGRLIAATEPVVRNFNSMTMAQWLRYPPTTPYNLLQELSRKG